MNVDCNYQNEFPLAPLNLCKERNSLVLFRCAISSIYAKAIGLLCIALGWNASLSSSLGNKRRIAKLKRDQWRFKAAKNYCRHKFKGHLIGHSVNRGRLADLIQKKDLAAAAEILERSQANFIQHRKENLAGMGRVKVREWVDSEYPDLSEDEIEELVDLSFEEFCNSHADQFEQIAAEEAAEIFPKASQLKQSLGGVCKVAILAMAAKRLHEGSAWTDIAADCTDGMRKEVAGGQSVYNALIKRNIIPGCIWDEYRLQTIPVISRDESSSDSENMRNLLELSNGIYEIGLRTFSDGHVILFERNNEHCVIADPNIGVLYSKEEDIHNLVARVLGIYPGSIESGNHQLCISQLVPMASDSVSFWERIFQSADAS